MKTQTKKHPFVNPWLLVIAGACISLLMVSRAIYQFSAEMENTVWTVTHDFPTVPAARITIDFGNGTRRTFESSIGHITYRLVPALQSAAQTGKLILTIRGGKIIGIARVKNKSSHAWRVYRNQKIQTSSVTHLTITGGDAYILRYE